MEMVDGEDTTHDMDEIKEALKARKKEAVISNKDFLSSGSTLLNLACSGRPAGAFLKGHYYFLVGDSASGKTFVSLTCLAEASINKNFGGYRFIYDNAEDGALMDIERFFGSEVARRMEPPNTEKDGTPVYSQTIEEFYYHVDDAVKIGAPFIYILDSMDSLSSEDEGFKFDQQKKAYRKGKEVPGSYGDGKAKKNSAGVRRLLPLLKKTGSILIIINQTRDNIAGFGFEKKTRSGGHALRFYATLEIWLSVVEKIKKQVKGKPRQIGIMARAKIKKNRITGKEMSVDIPIYHSYGIDDIGSCVDYLVRESHWKKGKGGTVDATEFGLSISKEEVVKHIQTDRSLLKQLRGTVGIVWDEIEEACALDRIPRYE
jgi:RecA/RadA recombinase